MDHRSRIGIIVAMDVEIDSIRNAMTEMTHSTISGIDFYDGFIHGYPAVAARSGIGKVCTAMCTQTMILRFHPCLIIGGGMAGALVEFPHGGIIIADKLLQHDFDLHMFSYPYGFIPSVQSVYMDCEPQIVRDMTRAAEKMDIPFAVGTIASGDCFINDSDKKQFIRENFHAIACEMEGASLAQVCTLNLMPFCVIRCISDSADENADSDNLANETFSSTGSALLILEYVKEVSYAD